MKIKIIINFKLSQNFSYYLDPIDENTLTIAFNSFEQYREFLNQTKDSFFIPQCFIGQNENNLSIRKLIDYLSHNIEKLIKLAKKQPIEVYNLIPKNIDSYKLPNQEMTVDLTNLSSEEIIRILSYLPWGEKTTFIDKYNPYHKATKNELIQTYESINEMIQNIKDANLSPAEIAFVVFDITRSRIYQKADNDGNPASSRDLCHILQEDYIVCAGFANLFSSMCCSLGVYSEVIRWQNDKEKTGHASSLVYINDPKYGINGIYAFEPTWNSKRDVNDTDYINNCRYAFIPLDLEIKNKSLKNLQPGDLGLFDKVKNCYSRLILLQSLKCPAFIKEKEIELITKYLNNIYNLIGKEQITNELSSEELKSRIKELESTKINAIDLEVFKRLIIQVRDFEHRINPTIYSIDNESIKSLIDSSISSAIKKQNLSAEMKLLRAILKYNDED